MSRSTGTGAVPSDHHDPNHPHYPGDLERQYGGRRPLLSVKRILIAGLFVTTALLATVAALGIVALQRKHDNNKPQVPEVLPTTNVSISAAPEVRTVYENITTTLYTTTRVPLLVVPTPATSTVVALPTSATPDASLRPVAARSALPTTAPDVIAASEALSGDARSGGCLFNGNWPMKKQCEDHCHPWSGRKVSCDVTKRSRWVCVACPA